MKIVHPWIMENRYEQSKNAQSINQMQQLCCACLSVWRLKSGILSSSLLFSGSFVEKLLMGQKEQSKHFITNHVQSLGKSLSFPVFNCSSH